MNLRPFPLFIDGVSDRGAAERWLEKQPTDVRRVTWVEADGRLMQKPVVDPGSYVDPRAQLIGGLIIRPGCYIAPFAVIRLDENNVPEPLIVGSQSNIQDHALVHSHATRIGERVIVAHQAIVHGAILEDEVALYIQAVADGNGTVIGRGSFLNQGAYVGKGIKVPPGRHVAPGRKVLTQAEADALPPVPEKLIEIQKHVLELNQLHVERHMDLVPEGDLSSQR
jgi:carbonic anhydrase/acetyltransferase-like protein (isoleucine patch superfamily)